MEEDYKTKTEDYWRNKLTPDQYRILRQAGTEPAFSGKLNLNKERGVYMCAGCEQELFSSDSKFDSGSGWPSFTDPTNYEKLELKRDMSYGMIRTEVLCGRCGSHLGHVFDDGPKEKGGKRYCINSMSLNFNKK